MPPSTWSSPDLSLGDNVRAQDSQGAWRSGRLVSRRSDGSFDVRCGDGETLMAVPVQSIRVEPVYPVFDGNATQPDMWAGGSAAGAPPPPPPPPDDDENRSVQYEFAPAGCEQGGGGGGRDDGGGSSELARERQAVRDREAKAPLVARPGGFRDGARVSADYAGLGYWHPATVSSINVDGTYTLTYDDGLVEERVPSSRMGGQNARAEAAPSADWGDAPRRAPSKPAAPRRRASPPPSRSREPAATESGGGALRVGSRAQGNWNGMGYWHPCTVVSLLPGGAFRLE